MFLHLGGDVIVPKDKIIAIFDLKITKKSETNRDFLAVAEEEEFIVRITEKENAKSFVITSEAIYYSPISSITLKKRAGESIGFEAV